LFTPRDDRQERLSHAVDEIRDKYGPSALKRASTLRRNRPAR
jgi:hypothetical protein